MFICIYIYTVICLQLFTMLIFVFSVSRFSRFSGKFPDVDVA